MKVTLLLIALTINLSFVISAQNGTDRKVQQTQASSAKPRSRFIRTPSIRTHFLEWNPTGKSTVVLLHGLYDSAEVWKGIAPLLAKDYRVIAVDRRGSGLTDKPMYGYDIPTLTQDVLSVIDGLELERVHLVGHSAGAAIALTVAATPSSKLSTVSLLDGGFWPRRSDGVGPVEPADCKVNDPDCVRVALIERGNRDYDPAPLYPGIKVPVLFVVAYPSEPEASKFSREIDEAHEIVRSAVEKVHDASFAVVRDSGHWIQRDQPTALANKLREFFNTRNQHRK